MRSLSSISHSDGVPSTNTTSKKTSIGELHLLRPNGEQPAHIRKLYAPHEIVIGRDPKKCQWTFNDLFLSKRHLRIYTIVYDNDETSQPEMLVYAEDLSRNGTFWNGSLIGKGNGGFLLSDGDKIRLSCKTELLFFTKLTVENENFDLSQEMEMKSFSAKYVLTDRLLGRGTFGRVFMAIEQKSRVQLACKVIDLRNLKARKVMTSPENPAAAEDVDIKLQLKQVRAWADTQKRDNKLEEKLKTYHREAEILGSLSHPNIVGLEKVYMTKNTIYMFRDLITTGDLFSYLESKNNKLLEVEAAVIVRQILIALDFLHKHGIVHRDVKPENIMMTSTSTGCRVVLTGFGSARKLNQTQRMSMFMGSEQYMAPEIFKQRFSYFNSASSKAYSSAIDMWSLGAVTVLLLTGGSVFANSPTEHSFDWQQLRFQPKDFVRKLLILDEETRMTAQEGLQDPWFSNELHKTDFELLYQRTIKHWHPRISHTPIFEQIGPKSTMMKKFCRPRNTSRADCQLRKSSVNVPIEPPYKPFPRKMYTEALWPKHGYSRYEMSEAVKTAIQEHWSPAPKEARKPIMRSLPLQTSHLTITPLSNQGSNTITGTPQSNSTEPSVAYPAPSLPSHLSAWGNTFQTGANNAGKPTDGESFGSGQSFARGALTTLVNIAPLPQRLKRCLASSDVPNHTAKRPRRSVYDFEHDDNLDSHRENTAPITKGGCHNSIDDSNEVDSAFAHHSLSRLYIDSVSD